MEIIEGKNFFEVRIGSNEYLFNKDSYSIERAIQEAEQSHKEYLQERCQHKIVCDGGYGRKRCVKCDAIVEATK